MNLTDLREAMGLSVSQVAEELGVPRQDVEDCEESGSTYLLQPFIAAFPINPAIMQDEDIDPFLDSYVQNTVQERAEEWRKENGISTERMAAELGMSAEQLSALEESGKITRALGIKIEKNVGMNRKWLMYGDGRNKGICILKPEKTEKISQRNSETEPEDEKNIANRNTAPNREGGLRLKNARKEAGFTRDEIAKKLGVSVSRIAQMESGYVREAKVDEIIEMMNPRSTGRDAGLMVREARKAAGLKLKDAAELVGLAAGTLAAMECGHISEQRAKEIIEIIQKKQKSDGMGESYSQEAGNRIREARKAVGMTQKELAVILRVPESTVGRLELGEVSEKRAEEIIHRINGAPRHKGTGPRRIKKTTKVLLGRQIRDAREAADLSQKAVGDLVGYPQSRISLMEKGQVDEATTAAILRAIETMVAQREAMGTEDKK